MNINPCKGCFSDMETRCHYLCDCYDWQENVAGEIMLILNLYGFILPPQSFIYHTGHSMQSMEEVRNGFYENQWLLNALENLARSIVDLIQLTQGHEWPGMPDVLFKTGKSSAR